MADIVYAVHTRTCTYLLDEDGVCRWIISPTGMVPPEVRRCVGAQFVACLDGTCPGGLVGELRLGANALFVRADEQGKLLLLRTAALQHVESRGAGGLAAPAEVSVAGGFPEPADDDDRPGIPLERPRMRSAPELERPRTRIAPELEPKRDPHSQQAGRAPRTPAPPRPDDGEVTVTLTMPLFRSSPPPPRRRPPGRRG